MSFNSRMGVAMLLALSVACSRSVAAFDDSILQFQEADFEGEFESLSSRTLTQYGGSYPSTTPTYAYSYGYGSYAPTDSYGSPAPTYYYSMPSPGGYAPSTPTYYYSVPSPGGYEPSTPTYYYTTTPPPSPGGYEPTTPTYYYSVPSPGGYEPTTPTYYYSVPSPGGYEPTTTPTYYYSVPSPGGYEPTTTPTYYYSVPSPGGYAPSTPTYYYSVPSPAGYSGSKAAPVYYYAPSSGGYAPSTGGYAPSTPTYYYSVPAPGGYSPATPTYYYVAPAPAPSECPACPTCPTESGSTGRRLSAQSIAPSAVTTNAHPSGTCYCPYDLEWKSWAISLKSCRDSLYTRCDADDRLNCKWLDEYFNPGSASGFMKAHEKDISEYLYQDCPPAAPCSCKGLKFDKRDEGSAVYSCCRDLAIWAQVPHSGISQKEVDAFCKAGKSDKVAAWVKHSLWHETCEVEEQPVYYSTRDVEPVESVKEAEPAVEEAAEAALPEEVTYTNSEPTIKYMRTPPVAPAVAPPVLVAGIVGLCAFVAVLGGVLGFHYARNAQPL